MKLTINCLVRISEGISARCSPIPYINSDIIVSSKLRKNGIGDKANHQQELPIIPMKIPSHMLASLEVVFPRSGAAIQEKRGWSSHPIPCASPDIFESKHE
jgi:hypothetical protein